MYTFFDCVHIFHNFVKIDISPFAFFDILNVFSVTRHSRSDVGQIGKGAKKRRGETWSFTIPVAQCLRIEEYKNNLVFDHLSEYKILH